MVVSATCESPCKGCKKRILHCHSVCPEYIKYKITLDRNREVIKAETDEQEFMLSVKQKVIQTYIKRRGHKKQKGDD